MSEEEELELAKVEFRKRKSERRPALGAVGSHPFKARFAGVGARTGVRFPAGAMIRTYSSVEGGETIGVDLAAAAPFICADQWLVLWQPSSDEILRNLSPGMSVEVFGRESFNPYSSGRTVVRGKSIYRCRYDGSIATAKGVTVSVAQFRTRVKSVVAALFFKTPKSPVYSA